MRSNANTRSHVHNSYDEISFPVFFASFDVGNRHEVCTTTSFPSHRRTLCALSANHPPPASASLPHSRLPIHPPTSLSLLFRSLVQIRLFLFLRCPLCPSIFPSISLCHSLFKLTLTEMARRILTESLRLRMMRATRNIRITRICDEYIYIKYEEAREREREKGR